MTSDHWVLFFNSSAVFSLLTKPPPTLLLGCVGLTLDNRLPARSQEGYTGVTGVKSMGFITLFSSHCSGAYVLLSSQLHLRRQDDLLLHRHAVLLL